MRTAALLVLATCATGCATIEAPNAPPAPPADLVAARQGSMRMAVAALAAVGQAAANDKQPVKRAAFPAGGLARFAVGMPVYFGHHTAAIPGTEAKPEIWSDPAGITTRIGQFRSATAALAAADDRAALLTAIESTKAACKACHDTYRIES